MIALRNAALIAIRTEPGEWSLSTLAADLEASADELLGALLPSLIAGRLRLGPDLRLHPSEPEARIGGPGTALRRVWTALQIHPGQTSRVLAARAKVPYRDTAAYLCQLRARGLACSEGSPLRWSAKEAA